MFLLSELESSRRQGMHTPPPLSMMAMTICLCHGGICELSIRGSWPTRKVRCEGQGTPTCQDSFDVCFRHGHAFRFAFSSKVHEPSARLAHCCSVEPRLKFLERLKEPEIAENAPASLHRN